MNSAPERYHSAGGWFHSGLFQFRAFRLSVTAGWLMLVFLLSHCAVQKDLEEADVYLYDGATIHLSETGNFEKPRRIRSDLEQIIQPDRNTKVGLWYHYKFGNPNKKKGLSNWIQRTLGEEPALFDTADISKSIFNIRDYLFDHGYYNARVRYDTTLDNRRIPVDYYLSSDGRYRIRRVTWPEDSTDIHELLMRHRGDSHLVPGEGYQVSDFVAERIRLEEIARNNGYYLFDETDIFYFVDSTASDSALQSDVWIRVKPPQDSLKHRQFYIGDTHVYPNYTLSRKATGYRPDSTRVEGLVIHEDQQTIKPGVLRQSIKQSRGDLFSAQRQNVTINHLLDLGIYKFVNQDFAIVQEADSVFLDRYLYLTPSLQQDISGSFDLSTRGSNFRIGVGANYLHKNLFGGAERLTLQAGTAFETGGLIYLGEDGFPNNLVEVSAQADISFPRFIVPFFRVRNLSSFYVPTTTFSVFASYQRRRGLFSQLNTRFSYGFDWQESKQKSHSFNPFNINLVNVSRASDAFLNFLESDIRLKRSFDNLFIFGPSYRYTYTNQDINVRRNYMFFQGQMELSGNLLYLFSSLLDQDGERPYTLLGREYSQYAKLEIDFRYNWVSADHQFVFRLAPGIIVPYLNSEYAPYIRQFFVGGPNSMRAFPNRGLLGSFIRPGLENVSTSYFDQAGDFKFETNLEYRFGLIKSFFLRGALFVDVGNVWLIRGDDQTDSRKVLRATEFFNELAIGVGTGLRIDLPFLVIRTDFALPFKKPYLEKGQRWAWREPGFINGPWLWKNLSLQIAVGYPF